MTTLHARVPKALAHEINKLVKLKLFKNESHVVEFAIKKMLAEQSREYLRELVKNMEIKEKDMFNEWEKIRG